MTANPTKSRPLDLVRTFHQPSFGIEAASSIGVAIATSMDGPYVFASLLVRDVLAVRPIHGVLSDHLVGVARVLGAGEQEFESWRL